MASNYQTMGAAFTQMWGEHALSSTSSSQLYQTLGQTWAAISKRIESRIASGKRHFATPMDDLVMDVMALKEALGKRKTIVYNYTKHVQEGRQLQEQMDKIRSLPDFSGHQDKYYQLEKDIRRSDLKVEEMKKLCALVSSRLIRDIERFRVEWHERMRQVLEDFHKQEIEFLQQQAMDFSSTLPSLSLLDSQRSALPTGSPPQNPKSGIKMALSTSGVKAFVGSIPIDHEASYPEVAAPPPATAPPPAPVSPTPVMRNHSFDDTKSLDSIVLDAVADDDEEETMTAMGGEINVTEKSGAFVTSIL
jgi:hypothetical protein